MRKLIFLILLVGGLSLTPHAVIAADNGLQVQGLSINPFIFEIDAEPGDTITKTITLGNTTQQPLNFVTSINDFVPNGTTGQPLFLATNVDADPKFSLSRWVTVTKQPQFTIPPLGQTDIEFTIQVPSDAEPGTHYGGILFGRPPGTTDSTGSAVQLKAGAIILVKLGKSQESIDLEQYNTDKHWYWHTPVTFTTLINNLGNVHTKPKGEITIRNIAGGQVIQLPINRDASIILPQSKREFSSIWTPKFAFGRYTGDAIIYYGNPKLTLTRTIVFWVVPVKQLIFILIGLVILLVLLRIVVKTYKRYIIRRARL